MPIIHILRYEPIKKDALIKLVGGYSNYSNAILIIFSDQQIHLHINTFRLEWIHFLGDRIFYSRISNDKASTV